MMLELPVKYPDLYQKFSTEGYHTARRSDRFWGGLWTELMIEQCMMRSIKSQGGLTRCRGITDTFCLTWIHSMHTCADVHNSMTGLTNLQHKTSKQHIELGKNRIKRDNADFKKIELFFEVNDPFDHEELDLRNLFTGLTTKTDDQINCDQTEEIGKMINEKLDGISFSNSSSKRKEQIKSLEELKAGLKLYKVTIYVDPSVLFSRLLLMIGREQRMIEYFRYELTPVPTSLFGDRMMRKSTKSLLLKAFSKNVSRDAYYRSPVYILDGGAFATQN